MFSNFKAALCHVNLSLTLAVPLAAMFFLKSFEENDLNSGHWVGPTLIDGVTLDMKISREEVFGPVLAIMRLKTLDEAIDVENSNPYGNAASIFTQSGAVAMISRGF